MSKSYTREVTELLTPLTDTMLFELAKFYTLRPPSLSLSTKSREVWRQDTITFIVDCVNETSLRIAAKYELSLPDAELQLLQINVDEVKRRFAHTNTY
jgi:hypothetical protein